MNADGSVKTAEVKAAVAKTAVLGSTAKLATLQAQKKAIDKIVTDLPATWAATGAVTDGAPALYSTLAALTATGTGGVTDMSTELKATLAKAKLL